MSKNTERIVALLTVAGVIIALFAWLAPFSPIGPSPLSPRNTLPADTVIPTQMQSTGQSTADINATAVAERVAERQSTVIALSTQKAKLGAGVLFEDNFDDGNAD